MAVYCQTVPLVPESRPTAPVGEPWSVSSFSRSRLTFDSKSMSLGGGPVGPPPPPPPPPEMMGGAAPSVTVTVTVISILALRNPSVAVTLTVCVGEARLLGGPGRDIDPQPQLHSVAPFPAPPPLTRSALATGEGRRTGHSLTGIRARSPGHRFPTGRFVPGGGPRLPRGQQGRSRIALRSQNQRRQAGAGPSDPETGRPVRPASGGQVQIECRNGCTQAPSRAPRRSGRAWRRWRRR